jgi:hypothetical protein
MYNRASGNLSALVRVAGSPRILSNITTTSGRMIVLFMSDESVSNAQGLQGFAVRLLRRKQVVSGESE